MPASKVIKPVVQVSLTVVVAYFVFRAVDWREVAEIAARADVLMLLAGVVMMLLLRLAAAMRWHVSLAVLGIDVSVIDLFKNILVSNSLGFLVPGGVGSDVMRAYQVYSEKQQLTKVVSTLVLERVLGILTLVATGTIGLAMLSEREFRELPFIEIVALTFAGIAVAGLLACALFLSASLRERVVRLVGGLPRVRAKITEIFTEIEGIGGAMVRATAISFAIQILRCVTFAVLFLAFSSEIEFSRLLVVVPVIFVLLLLPISVGGLGIREGALVVYSAFLGVPAEQALVVGLSFYLIQILLLVPGFAIVVMRSVARKAEAGL